MPELKFVVSATQEQAAEWAQCQALVMFLPPNEIEAMRMHFSAVQVLAQQMQAGISKFLEANPSADPEGSEILLQVSDMAEQTERRIHELKLKIGTSMFAVPGANGETIQ